MSDGAEGSTGKERAEVTTRCTLAAVPEGRGDVVRRLEAELLRGSTVGSTTESATALRLAVLRMEMQVRSNSCCCCCILP